MHIKSTVLRDYKVTVTDKKRKGEICQRLPF